MTPPFLPFCGSVLHFLVVSSWLTCHSVAILSNDEACSFQFSCLLQSLRCLIFFFTSLKYRQRILLFTLFSPFFQTGTLIRFGSGQILSGDNLGYKTCFLYRLRQFIDSFPKGINTLIVCIFFGFVLLIGGLEFDPGPGRPLPPGRVCVSRRWPAETEVMPTPPPHPVCLCVAEHIIEEYRGKRR